MTDVGVARNAPPCLALDIGATKVEAALVDAAGTLSARSRINDADHHDDLITAVIELARRVMAEGPVDVVGVGCAGPMSRGGEEVSPLNIPQWRGFPLRRRLRDALGLDVFVDGDARALALAEGAFGAAREQSSYLSMVVSTGVGGGLVIDGELLDGESGNAGHIGHLNVVPNGNLCSCGAFGCLEAEASGWAIEARTGVAPADAGAATRTRTAELVGRAIGTLASVLDFNHCYVAGSVALGYGDEFFDVANKSARSMARLPYSEHLEIVRSELGADGPLLGAALVAWRGRS
jgi:glucokinase